MPSSPSPTSSAELVSVIAQKRSLASSPDACIICDLPTRDRRDIEEMMACGVSDRTVSRVIAQKTGVTVDAKVIASHIDHLPATYFTYREILQSAADEAGIKVGADQSTLTPVGYIRAVMQDAMSTLASNPKSTNQMVGIAAAKTLIEAQENSEANADVSRWIQRFRQLTNAVKMVCSRDQVQRILEILEDGGDDGQTQ